MSGAWTLAAVVLAAVAAGALVTRPQQARRLDRADDSASIARPRSGGSAPRRWALLATCLLCAPIAGVLLAGVRGAVVALALGMVAAAVLREVSRHRVRRRQQALQAEVARACAALAAQLRAGRIAAEAVALCTDDHPVLVPAARTLALGGDPTVPWLQQSERPGLGGLRDLAQGWAVSVRTGAPLATTLEQVSAALHRDQTLRRVIINEVASPRATAKVMAALPFAGIGLGYLIGGNPLAFLIDGPVGWACLLLGVLLAALGVAWIEAMARRSEAT